MNTFIPILLRFAALSERKSGLDGYIPKNLSCKPEFVWYKRIYQDVRARIFIILLFIWIVNIISQPKPETVSFPLVSIIFLSILDLSFTYIKSKKIYIPFSSLISGLLIAMLIHPSQGLAVFIFAVILTFISKQYIKIKKRHIFNPAAFGAVISTLIFNTSVSWWMVTPGQIILIFLLLSSIVLYKIKRLQYPLLFLAGYFLYLSALNGISGALSLTLDPTLFLFAFIMLPEPMTTRIDGVWKYGFSLLVLAIIIFLNIFHISFTDPLLISLLGANLIAKVL